MKKELLIVDGYNMIGAWPDLVALKSHDKIEAARDLLLVLLSDYAAFRQIEVWVIFDAQFVPGIQQTYEEYNLKVVFTKEKETADSYIERTVSDLATPLTQVTVATSDLAEQWIIFQRGALRQSARDLYRAIQKSQSESLEFSQEYQKLMQRKRTPWEAEQIKDLKRLLDDLSQHE
ncbi:NYN domain-containing protein [Bavariicoccus seileri]|uniref:NYN domain-containing protein n=1 Tax=Bavariicoccus seileri TaxID=549685 RepID=UPI0003B589F3|nr:NYN domain-containing protein [Bavariicoccus seileri]